MKQVIRMIGVVCALVAVVVSRSARRDLNSGRDSCS